MKKFIDKLTDSDSKEEVELNPDNIKRQRTDKIKERRDGEVELQASQSETASTDSAGSESSSGSSGGMLPGMGSGGSGSSTTTRPSRDSGGEEREDRIETVIQQNERIIELLETISNSYQDTDTDSDSNELW
jgi:hypothetical protein